MLDQVKTELDALQASVKKYQGSLSAPTLSRIASEITEPLQAIQQRTLQLQRIHEACELLRKISRFLLLAKKLRGHIEGCKDNSSLMLG